MTKFILIRHGETTYEDVKIYDLGKLTDLGISQAELVSKDKRLEGAEIIVSSPYTRALQTAAIISRLTNIPIIIENDVHEWLPDTTYKANYQEGDNPFKEYWDSQGIKTKDTKYPWETQEELTNRFLNALSKYKNYKKVVVVSHGLIMRTTTHFEDHIKNCEIREFSL